MTVGGDGAVHDLRGKAKGFRVRSHWHKSQESASEIGAKRMALSVEIFSLIVDWKVLRWAQVWAEYASASR